MAYYAVLAAKGYIGVETLRTFGRYDSPLGHHPDRNLVPGVEFFGDAGQIRRFDPARAQQHYVFPTLYGRLARGLKFVVGPGFGLTRASDPVIVRLGVEYEFTLPAGGGGGPPRPTY